MSDMGYLVSHIYICLLIAALIGGIIGWLLRHWTIGATNETSPLKATARVGATDPTTDYSEHDHAPAPDYPIEEIEGIGRVIGERLRSFGVDSTLTLLDRCRTPEICAQAASVAKVDEAVMKQWVVAADLLRVPGVDGQFAELLEAADISNVQTLAEADTNNLHAMLRNINEQQRRVPNLPSVEDVAQWIAAARSLPRALD